MYRIKFKGLRENIKIIFMAILLAGAIGLTYYYHAVIGTGRFFTHLFYIPIILASIWWKKKGVLVAVFLAIMLILSHHFLRADTLVLNDYLRFIMFVIIASVVALLSSQISKIENLLGESKEWLSTTLRSIGDAVIATDMKGHVAFLNPVAENITGWKHQDAIGKHINEIFNIINEETGEPAENPIERVLREGVVVGLANHTVLIAKNGTKYSIDDSGAPITDDKGHIVGVVLVFHEITERRRTEKQLQLLSSIAKQTTEGMALVDLDGNLQFVNNAFAQMHGYTPEELLGKNLSIFHTPEQISSVEAANRQIKETGKFRGEIWHVRRDGTVFPTIMNNSLFHDNKGKAIGMIGVVRDITIRRQAEKALQKEKETAQRYFDVAGTILIAINTDQNVININRKGCEVTGYSEKEIVGKNWFDLCIPEPFRNNVKAVFSQLMKGEIEPVEYYENPIVTKSGDERIIAWHNTLLKDDSGKTIGCFSSGENITRRKQAEQALKESEKRFRDITENALEWVWEVDKEGKYTYASSVVEKVLGYKSEEILNKHFYDLFHPEEREEYKKAAFEVFGKKQSFVEFINRNVHKNGNMVWLSTSGLPILNEDGNLLGYRGADTDITERKIAEEALRESEERYRAIWENSPAGICLTDRDGVYHYVNPAYCKTYGYTEEQLIGRQFYEMIVRPEDKEERRKSYTERFDTGEPVPMGEVEFIKSNGEPVWIQFTGDFIKDKDVYKYLVSMNVDITERKIAEEALATESERLAVTLRSIGDGVITTDIKGNVVLLNKVAETLTGWSEKEAKGKQVSRVFNIINEATRHPCENPVEKVIEKGLIVGLANHTVLVHKDGTERFIADSGAPIRSKDGEIIGVVLVFRDVTETRKMQEFISRAQRLETAGRIAGQVAHDFNNLLGPLVAYPDFIRESLPKDHQAIAFLNDMEKAADQIADINQQLLTLGRRGHYNQEPLNLNQIVLQVINQIYPIPDTLVIETDLHKNLLNIKGGASQIYRVIANFISNACDAMQNIGQLTIKTENYYADTTSGQFGRIPKGEYVKLTISDTGCGIPKDIKPRIFDPFFTTKTTDKRRGSGLGLSVAHAVVEDHNGYIDMESAVGKGTAFYAYLPITREAVEDDITDEIVGGTESVLVVDDDQVQQDVTVKLLLKLGYQPNAVNSGEKAIEFLKENPQDLLILDMVMPEGIDGTETYQKTLEINPSQKAIIVSGFAESERVEAALKLGAGAFIRKPLTLKTIAPAVRKELDRKVK